MKKILSLFLITFLLISLGGANVFAGEEIKTEEMQDIQQTYVKTIDEATEKFEHTEKEQDFRPIFALDENGDAVVSVGDINLGAVLSALTENIKTMGFASNIKMGVHTADKNYLAQYTWQNGCDVKAVITFAEGLFDELTTQITGGSPSASQNETYCDFNLKHDEGYKSVRHQVSVRVWDGGASIQVNKEDAIRFKVRDSNAIIKYLDTYCANAFDGFKYENYDENTPYIRGNIEGLIKTDKLSFQFVLSDDADGSLVKEVAAPGETVTGAFEKYKENKYKSTYILTLSGSLGTLSLFNQTQSSLSGEDEYFSNNIPISFLDTFRFEQEQLVEYKIGKTNKSYKLKMVFRNNNIAQVDFEDVLCSNLKYTQITDDTKLADEYTEKDKEVTIKEAGVCADTLYDLGLFKGTDKGYELEKGLTREESATILVRLLGEEKNAQKADFDAVFSDVDKERWSYVYVMYCYENHITKGTSESTFSPDAQIDAAQFVALLMRLLGYTEVSPDTALDKSVQYKLLPADMAETLENTEVFTRREMVQVVYNSLKTRMEDETLFSAYLQDKGVLTEEEIARLE